MRNKLLTLGVLLCGTASVLLAQCPTSTRSGVHVVQQGENLYRISQRYGLQLREIMAWNNLQQDETLALCRELVVTAPTTYGATDGRILTPRTAETVPYASPTTTTTTERPRPSMPDRPYRIDPDGSIVYTTPIRSSEAPVRSTPPPSTPTTRTLPSSGSAAAPRSYAPRGGTYVRQPGSRHTVQPGQTVRGLADLYGYTERRFREFNSLGNDEVTPGSVVLSTDCSCADRANYAQPDGYGYREGTRGTAPSQSSVTRGSRYDNPTGSFGTPSGTPSTPARTNPRPQNYDYDLPRAVGGRTTATPRTGSAGTAVRPARSVDRATAGYMQPEELDMLDEINLMRRDPAGYVPYVRAYAQRANSGQGFPVAQATVAELIGVLESTPPLSTLQPMRCVYDAARKHGDDIRQRGNSNHVGSDGSYPWDRVLRECPQLTDGNENLVAGPATVRDAVIMLLLDEGIPERGHRVTLMQPDWRYGATYKIGQVGSFPNSWVQKFAR